LFVEGRKITVYTDFDTCFIFNVFSIGDSSEGTETIEKIIKNNKEIIAFKWIMDAEWQKVLLRFEYV